MRDRHRAAGPDLLGQHSEQRAARAQDVAEADAREHGLVAALLGLVRGALHDDLGQPLGRAEDRRRVGGLVGRDQDEALGAVLDRRADQVVSALRVGLHTLARVPLQQRQVFVRRRVEHHLGPQVAEDLVHAVPVADVGDQQVAVRVVGQQRLAPDLQLEPVQVGLVVVQQVQRIGPEIADLAAQFTADGPARPGDQHAPAGDQRGSLLAHHVMLARSRPRRAGAPR